MKKKKQGRYIIQRNEEKKLNKLDVIRNTLHYEYRLVILRFKQIDLKKVDCEKKIELIDLISKSGRNI